MAVLNIAIVGAPVDLGAGRRGVDMGPSAMRYTGLQQRLADLGHHVRDTGNLSVPMLETHPAPVPGEPLRYLEPIAELCTALAGRVAACVREGYLPLVLGGDHSISIGSVAGAAQGRTLGLLWLDAHADFNTSETTPSGNIHGMPVAVLTGRGHRRLTEIGGHPSDAPTIDPRNVALVGVRSLDAREREALRDSGISVFTMHDIDRQGVASVMQQALEIISRNTQGFHASFDLDVLDPHEAPGVGTAVPGGISYREAHLAMELLAQTGGLRSLDLVEVNPILDEHNTTAKLAVELALSALGKRIL
jgi:arginase